MNRTQKNQELHATTWGKDQDNGFGDYPNGKFAWFKQAKFDIFIHWGFIPCLRGSGL